MIELKPLRIVTFVVLLSAAAGCGGSSTNGTMNGPSSSQKAQDVADMLKEHYAGTNRAPASVADLTDAPASHPVGHAAVASKEFIVFWRAPISQSGSRTILAYHKDVPSSGGSVIMQDGSVKEMTADEFKAAPKAK